jgi:hypothetical protein
LKGPVTLIGASEQAELRLSHAGAAEACAMILRLGEGYWLWNLDQASPCRINGASVVRAALVDGNVLTIGEQDFRFHVLANAEPAKVTPNPPAAAPVPPPARVTPVVAKVVRAPQNSSKPTATVNPPAPKPPAPVAPPKLPAASKPSTVAAPTQPTPTIAVAPAAPAAPAPAEGSEPAPSMRPVESALPVRRLPVDSVLEDDADVFKQWGPLAFAVAAADRPELQPGGSRSGSARAVAETAPKPQGGRVVKLIAIVVLLAGGLFVAWKYGKSFLHP